MTYDVHFWGPWYPCFGLLVTCPLGFKAEVGSVIRTWRRRTWEKYLMLEDSLQSKTRLKNLQKLLLSRALYIHFWSLKTWDQGTAADLRDHVSQVLYNYVTKDFSTKTAIEISRFLPPIYPFSGSAILCTCVCGGRGEFRCRSRIWSRGGPRFWGRKLPT